METAERSTKLEAINKDVTMFVQKTNSLIIKTKEDMVGATEFLANIVARKKRVEEIRLSYTKPLNETLSNINTDFKKVSVPLINAENIVKSKMVAYRKLEFDRLEKIRLAEEEKQRKINEKEAEKQRKIAEKEAERERERLAKEDMTKKARKAEEDRIEQERLDKQAEIDQAEKEFVPEVNNEQEKTVHSESGAVRARKVWKFEIENEKKIHKEYLTVDEVKIRQAIKSGVREIAGVRIYEDEQIGVY